MERYRWLLFLPLVCAICSCKKEVEMIDPEILVENVYVEFVTSERVDLNYKLSHLGYQETGVSYYKKSAPANVTVVKAIRKNDVLKLSLLGLESNTEYVFNVFFKHKDAEKTDLKAYTVKTLSKELAKFALEIKNSPIYYDDKGDFTAEIEGENINNLNLSGLDIRVNGTSVILGYPVLVAGSRYKMAIKGAVNPRSTANIISGRYNGNEILFQSVPFAFEGERYWFSYTATSLPGNFASVFNNELYYFFNDQVHKWNDPEQRLSVLGRIPNGTVSGNVSGIQFDGQFFFIAAERGYWPNPNDMSDNYYYPESYSYTPNTGKWEVYPFKAQTYSKRRRIIHSNNYFVHKGELYLSYGLVDDVTAIPSLGAKSDNFIFHYNKETKQFEAGAALNSEIINYQFISIDNQMYLTGLVPVYDQGFKMSATFAVFKVSDQSFKLEEIYRGGTVAQPLTIMPKNVMEYEHKILIATAQPDNFYLFDPSVRQFSEVFLRNGVPDLYWSRFFTYNNKLHLNTGQKIYEMSIVKTR